MHTLEELTARLARATRALSERRGQQHRLILDRGVCSARLDAAKEQTQVFEQVAFLLQQTAEHARVQARQRIESLVTSTLRSVFGPDYAFRIELVEKGEVTKEEAREFVKELAEKGEQEREALQKTIRMEMERIRGAMGLISGDDLRKLEERLQRIEEKLNADKTDV